MKSNIIMLPSGKDENALQLVLAETEKVAAYQNLEKKQTGRLRLLAEEMVEMLPELLSFAQGEFWIECTGTAYELHTRLQPSDLLSMETRETLLSMSKSGKNAAAVGIGAKIRLAALFMLIDYKKATEEMPLEYTFYQDGLCASHPYSLPTWSLAAYRKTADKTQTEKWDELEKSIIANLADDVLVGVTEKQVEIIVKKTF